MNTKKKGISVVINTYNAGMFLDKCLDSVKGFDEIVICDMYSPDNTLAIARKYNARIIMFEYVGIVEPARNFAMSSADYEWTLLIDADEVVPPELRDYLFDFISKDEQVDGLSIPFKNFFMGRCLKCLYPDYHIRFFRSLKTHWSNSTVHSSPIVDGVVEKIPSRYHKLAILHHADNSIHTKISKTNKYTEMEQLRYEGKTFNVFKLWFKSWWRFFRLFILKGGFRDGVPGYIYAKLDSFYKFVSIAKKIESQYEQYR